MSQSIRGGSMAMEDLELTMAALVALWVYLPGFLVNTFAMMWGKWFPRTGAWPVADRWRSRGILTAIVGSVMARHGMG